MGGVRLQAYIYGGEVWIAL